MNFRMPLLIRSFQFRSAFRHGDATGFPNFTFTFNFQLIDFIHTEICRLVAMNPDLSPRPSNLTWIVSRWARMPDTEVKCHFCHCPDTQTHTPQTDCSTRPLKWSVTLMTHVDFCCALLLRNLAAGLLLHVCHGLVLSCATSCSTQI